MENFLNLFLEFNPGLPDSIRISTKTILIAIAILAVAFLVTLPWWLGWIFDRVAPPSVQAFYREVFSPYRNRLGLLLLLSVLDLILLIISKPAWLPYLEIPFALVIAGFTYYLAFQIFKQIFDVYLLDRALSDQRKINSEFLVVSRFLSNVAIVLVIAFLFAQLHQVNVVGLLASVGVGGVALAFASQKILEQGLWGIVLFLDKPFDIDDYIHLNDRTFGRVELIGWRSTRIRLSGKGSLVIVPNSILCQQSVENLSKIRKQISILKLTFYREIPDHEQALVKRVILASTEDIFGIDHPLTQVNFRNISDGKGRVMEAQVTFFILGSGTAAEDLRTQLLETARKKIALQLKEYGIAFTIEEQITNVQSPMSV